MKTSEQSRKDYNKLFENHEDDTFMEEIEYYKVLSSLIKGKKSVDIGCGYGGLETLSPNTVGVDFSEKALEIARKRGVKNLVKAAAENLPFEDDEFEISVSMGVFEHVSDIDKAISEMVRVSEIQILVVHAALPYGLEIIRRPFLKLAGLGEQPIENPQTLKNLKKILNKHGARVVIEGVWNYVDLRWLNPKIPYGLVKWPSHHFIISIKTDNVERKFLKDLGKVL